MLQASTIISAVVADCGDPVFDKGQCKLVYIANTISWAKCWVLYLVGGAVMQWCAVLSVGHVGDSKI